MLLHVAVAAGRSPGHIVFSGVFLLWLQFVSVLKSWKKRSTHFRPLHQFFFFFFFTPLAKTVLLFSWVSGVYRVTYCQETMLLTLTSSLPDYWLDVKWVVEKILGVLLHFCPMNVHLEPSLSYALGTAFFFPRTLVGRRAWPQKCKTNSFNVFFVLLFLKHSNIYLFFAFIFTW